MSDNYQKNFTQILDEFKSGDKSKAFKKQENYLKNNPNDDVARFNFAIMCDETNKEDLAIKNYKQVIMNDKSHWESRFNLYILYLDKKLYKQAHQYVNEVLEIKKNFYPAQRDKALILNYLQKPDEAFEYIVSALKQNQNDHIALNTLGLILISLKRLKEAKNTFIRAIEINPKYFSSYNNLGHCYTLLHKRKKSFEAFSKALTLNPKSLEVKNNLANYFIDKGDYNKALDYYFEALKFDPKNNSILFNTGIAYTNLNNEDKAEEYYKKSYAINPNSEGLHKAYSMLLLKQGRYKEAWKLFEGRLKLGSFYAKDGDMYNMRKKLSNNKKLLKEDKILVVREQGIGDEILYASMYEDMLKKYPNTCFESDKRLITLFERSLNIKSENIFFPFGTFTRKEKDLTNFNNVTFAGSLGKLFRNDIRNFTGKNFLKPELNKVTEIKKILDDLGKEKKIGISWKSQKARYSEDKTINLEELKPIFKIPNVKFINLQYGETHDELENFQNNENIKITTINKLDLFNDFESICALLKNLNLFVTVSNSTAHLAGAVGVPTFLIKPPNHATFHYWNQKNERTPWYNSIKLFNNKNAIQNIKKEIIKFIN
ncbi:MAG: tetratricopeptide repeat protein [Pelagibacteraceae bacterium]|jgi:tetratricopeptide (TPR) repeat protein|nr:tetratricopeptide repeat protein [Pelagibacteraceae bacterium]HJO14251.1 tetratricopeptide repeat protein [Alphaproteobacteria bacterium]MBO6468261.1 tetratricopeptide repeat protein [Pelagibacteraceae bacterium]MBO6468644.1 tetratricopeptide repeat protein [Pelagibacteraceae bacterium]MBO6469800.1 tetratricopeptide repeat protein [Pelagibacteraceae bacterium]